MDVLEALMRDTLAEHADDAPQPDGLLEAVTAPRQRARWLLLGAAAAVVLLAVGLTVEFARGHSPQSQSDGAGHHRQHSLIGPLFHLPDKTVAYNGVVVTVPGDLPVLTGGCPLPASYVFAVDPNVAVGCPLSAPVIKPDVTVLLTDQAAVIPSPRLHELQQTAYVSGTHVLVTVSAPSSALVHHILASIRVAPDPNGCPSRVTTVSNARARHLVSGHPDDLVRCVYARAGWLQASISLQQTAFIASRINALPATGAAAGGAIEHDQLRFGYADASVRTLDVQVDATSVFTDGVHTGYDVGSRVMNLIRGYS
jgi:hypothetical protein